MEENKTTALAVPVCHELQERLGSNVDVRKLSAAIRETAARVTVAFEAATEAFKKAALAVLNSTRDFAEWLRASSWANGVHHKWLIIYRRTKKRRIKKKYRDRILRAYRAEMAKQEADCGL